MRLFEAILEANHRALAGDPKAGLRPADFADELPLVVLTCIDPRLNRLLPGAMGIPEDQFIDLRNAGNIVTGPLSSTMRSLTLACAVKGGKEIALIGHTDCHVCATTAMQLLEKLKGLGVERGALPENLNEYFGMFASERQNVIKGCDIIRHSPLIGPRIPVHGLLVDIHTGKLDWIVNGYHDLEAAGVRRDELLQSTRHSLDAPQSLAPFQIGEMKFPESKIGEQARITGWRSGKVEPAAPAPPIPMPHASPVHVANPAHVSVPPPIRLTSQARRAK